MRKELTVHAVPTTHIDIEWLWHSLEGEETVRSTARSVTTLSRQYPQTTYAGFSPYHHQLLHRVEPDIFDQFYDLARQNRLSLAHAGLVDGDKSTPGGEASIRNLSYGQETIQRLYGKTATIATPVDTFGFDAGYPRDLVGTGFEAAIYKRPEKHELVLPGENVFWWMGPDGSKVLMHHTQEYGTWGKGLKQHYQRIIRDMDVSRLNHALMFVGTGNHGGGPTRENFDWLIEKQKDPAQPKIIFSSPETYFEAIKKQVEEDNIRLYTHEGPLRHHAPGCYSSNAEIKRENRRAERNSLTAETMATVVFDMYRQKNNVRFSYPSDELHNLGEDIAYLQFHDIVAGTSIPPVYESAKERYGGIQAKAERIRNDAIHAISREIDIPFHSNERALVLFNPATTDTKQYVEMHITDAIDPKKPVFLKGPDGKAIPVQQTERHFVPRPIIGFVADVPSVGYSVYRFSQEGADEVESSETMNATDSSIESSNFSFTIDKETGGIQIFDKRFGRNIFTKNHFGAIPVILDDQNDAWGHALDKFNVISKDTRFVCSPPKLVKHGTVVSAIEVEYAIEKDGIPGKSKLKQTFQLAQELCQIDVTVDLTLDDDIKRKAIKLDFPVNVKTYPEVTVETPYGTQMIATDGLEQPGQSWIDVSGTSPEADGDKSWHGLGIINNGKYSFSASYQHPGPTTASMMIARTTPYADEQTDNKEHEKPTQYLDHGHQTFHYTLIPHADKWQQTDLAQRANTINQPIIPHVESAHEGNLPLKKSFVSLEVPGREIPNVIIGAVKKADKSDDTIVRLCEMQGIKTQNVTLDINGRPVTIDIDPKQILTVCIPKDAGKPYFVNMMEQKTSKLYAGT